MRTALTGSWPGTCCMGEINAVMRKLHQGINLFCHTIKFKCQHVKLVTKKVKSFGKGLFNKTETAACIPTFKWLLMDRPLSG